MTARLSQKRGPKPLPADQRKPSRWRESDMAQPCTSMHCEVALHMARAGRTDAEIIERLGVPNDLFYEWKKNLIKFRDALIMGREGTQDLIENALVRSILGGEQVIELHVPDKETGELRLAKRQVTINAPNASEALKWLERRNRERWKPPPEEKNLNVTFRKALMELAELDPDD